jgi:hypothetical protein
LTDQPALDSDAISMALEIVREHDRVICSRPGHDYVIASVWITDA